MVGILGELYLVKIVTGSDHVEQEVPEYLQRKHLQSLGLVLALQT